MIEIDDQFVKVVRGLGVEEIPVFEIFWDEEDEEYYLDYIHKDPDGKSYQISFSVDDVGVHWAYLIGEDKNSGHFTGEIPEKLIKEIKRLV
jgi:hypothetical protein